MKAVILDMDGLMLDTEPLYRAAWPGACAELGFVLDDAAYEPMIGRPNDACEAQLLKRFGAEFPMARFRALWPELWKAHARAHGIHRMPGLEGLLGFLENRAIPMAVATSSDAEYTDLSLRTASLTGRFETVVTRDQVAHGKPAPDLYVEAARRLGIEPEACIALEDSDPGVQSAATAGMKTICVPGSRPPSVKADYVVRDLDEARVLIQTMLTEATRKQ
jgi:HAD superfamily hydrolase (TIGR01509 family)